MGKLLSDPAILEHYVGRRGPIDRQPSSAVRRAFARYRSTCAEPNGPAVASLLAHGAEPQLCVELITAVLSRGLGRQLVNVGISAFEIAILAGYHEVVVSMLARSAPLQRNGALMKTGLLLAHAGEQRSTEHLLRRIVAP